MKLILAFIALLLVPFTLAVQYSEYTIENDKVLVEHTFSKSRNIDISIPKDAEAISVSHEGIEVPYEIELQMLGKILHSQDASKISYVSKELLEQPKNTFFVEEVQVHDPELKIKVRLPEKATLAEPLFGGFGSIYPKPTRVETDGRTISFYWENITAEKTFPLLIEYSPIKKDNSFIIFSSLAILFGAGITALILLRKKTRIVKQEGMPATQEIATPVIKGKTDIDKIIEKEAINIEMHLKEDEKTVINVLKLKNGSTSQATLRIATGFSKATLSRLLMELEARKIIVKEKKGNKNLIILKSSIWNDLEQED